MPRGTQIEFLLAGVRDNSGNALSSGKVYFYLPGTSTPVNVYTNKTLATTAEWPVILNADGGRQVYGNGEYDVTIKTSADVTVRTFTNLMYKSVTALEYEKGMNSVGYTSGPANTYALSLPDFSSAYADGPLLIVQFNIANTGASTLNVNGLGAQSIFKSTSVAVASGDLVANKFYLLKHDTSAGFFIVS